MSGPLGTIIEDEQAFLIDVEAFYRERGTSWERDAKVAGRPISLHQLYKTVMELGGYDKISAERMAWRRLLQPFALGTQHEPAMTFQLKTVYYKNLAAYEIARYWGEEPPPPQILEDLTAKGGDLRNRTLATYLLPSRNADARDSEDEESQKTPVKEKADLEDPGSGRRYPARELRQDPKRTQIYQPDPTPQRNRIGRATGSPQASPAPQQSHYSAMTDPRNPSFNLSSYVPREPMALSLRPVMTPGNAAEIFYQRKAERPQMKPRERESKHLDQLRYFLPSRHGPSIYNRCHMGLMSGIEDEVAFALHHLVNISMERGDKFTFKGFIGLAESLIEKALEVSTLIHGVKWEISYEQEEGVSAPQVLNANFGTPGLLESVRSFNSIVSEDGPETTEFAINVERVTQAVLVMRNMLILEENAVHMSSFALLKDFLIIAMNLPKQPRLVEFHFYALEMAEMVTRYWNMESNDPLYLSLVDQLNSDDRSILISTLKAITLIGIENVPVFQITDFPQSILERLIGFIHLDDDGLVEPVLDFLYEFTAIPANVISSLQHDGSSLPLLSTIIPRLIKLLYRNAVTHVEKIQNRTFIKRQKLKSPIPEIPNELYMQLLQYPEPDRSSRWLRCCFEESPEDDITQIAIWQAYQSKFAQTGHIAAADFIKNVSSTFREAQAQVINIPPQPPRFIIRGITPRRVLVDTQGRPYFKCMWETSGQKPEVVYDFMGRQKYICGNWFNSPQGVWLHILTHHCNVPHGADGELINDPPAQGNIANGANHDAPTNIQNAASATVVPTKVYKCRMLGCGHTLTYEKASAFSKHLTSFHIPKTSEEMAEVIARAYTIPNANEAGIPRPREPTEDEKFTQHIWYYTPTDLGGHPCGISFMAAMILRNLARFVVRFGGEVDWRNPWEREPAGSNSPSMRRKEKSDTDRRQDLSFRLFDAVTMEGLWGAIATHRTLSTLINDVMSMIQKARNGEKKRGREDGPDTIMDGVQTEETQ